MTISKIEIYAENISKKDELTTRLGITSWEKDSR